VYSAGALRSPADGASTAASHRTPKPDQSRELTRAKIMRCRTRACASTNWSRAPASSDSSADAGRVHSPTSRWGTTTTDDVQGQGPYPRSEHPRGFPRSTTGAWSSSPARAPKAICVTAPDCYRRQTPARGSTTSLTAGVSRAREDKPKRREQPTMLEAPTKPLLPSTGRLGGIDASSGQLAALDPEAASAQASDISSWPA
jgi:hypothetical protein